MPITKNPARQELIQAYVDINLADVTTGVDVEALDLPIGAVIVDGALVTTEAWNSTTSDVMDVGDGGSQNRYLNDGNIRALAARVPLVPTGFVTTSTTNKLTVRWVSGGGSPSTGKVRLEVTYYRIGRAAFSQG
ncbi:MAG: hypothetical protein ACKOWC_03935 [Limnohabitans sp.]